MELTPQLLTDEIDFRIAVRGYDRNEVDDFLERVAVAVGQLQSQLTKAATRARNAENRLKEFESGSAAPETIDKAVETPEEVAESAEVVAPVAAPKAPPAAPETSISDDEALNDELRRTLVLAQRTADTAIREARDEARTIVEQAREAARATEAEAEVEANRAREEARRRLVAEIAELEALRETMRHDTVVLDRYLGTERTRVRETIQVLRRLVDDPESFRPGAVPEISDTATPSIDAPTGADSESETSPEVLPTRGVARAEQEVTAGAAYEPEHRADTAAPEESASSVEAEAVSGENEPEATTPDARTETASVDDEPDEVVGSAGDEPTGPGDEQESTPATDSEQLGQLFDAADTNRDWRSERPAREDQGPHTQPVAAARFEEESDEAFLAELRRAMDDDEPLGPEEDS